VIALAKSLLSSRYRDIDTTTAENAKKRILDVIGCLINDASSHNNSTLIELFGS
jgi:2-methylcitrate dehydratase PrpD